MRAPAAALLLLLACAWLATSRASEGRAGGDEAVPLAERQYRTAMQLRARKDASLRQLQQAASLLKAAAGVRVAEPGQEAGEAENVLMPRGNATEVYPGIKVTPGGSTAALKALSYIYSQEGEGLPFNPRAAFELMRAAAAAGDPEAQREWGLLLAIGAQPPPVNATHKQLFQLGQRDWPQALLHLTLAAAGNDSVAQLALGYRHAHGLGVPKSCAAAVLHYQAAAERVTEAARFPYAFPRVERVRLAGAGRGGGGGGGPPSREQELLHYQWFADMGYVDAQRTVGRLLAQGDAQQARRALHYFRQAAAADDGDAMAQLGHAHANGIGVAASNASALKWFRAGAERGSPSAHLGLGYMYLQGRGLPQDYRLAVKFLTAAAEQGHPEAWFHLGSVHLHGWGVPVSLQQAQSFLAMAAKAGHVLAQYNLAMIHLRTRGAAGCEMALERLKAVAERGPWVAILQDASDAFAAGRPGWALLGYLKAGEMGYELAQANAAWLLAQDQGLPPGRSARGFVQPGQAPAAEAAAAIRAHQRASQQGNVDSMLAIGDAFYYGRGVPRDWPTAFQVYAAAARFRNAQALFNLGFMHEYGAGVPPDLALAKRQYDKARELMPGAAAPVRLALAALSLHALWDRLRPLLPARFAWLWARVFALQQPDRVTGPAGSYLPRPSLRLAGLDRLAAGLAAAVQPLGTALARLLAHPHQAGGGDGGGLDGELLETLMLLILIGCLWLVVWRRMSRRGGRRRQQQQQGPGAQPPSAPAAAASAGGGQPAGGGQGGGGPSAAQQAEGPGPQAGAGAGAGAPGGAADAGRTPAADEAPASAAGAQQADALEHTRLPPCRAQAQSSPGAAAPGWVQ